MAGPLITASGNKITNVAPGTAGTDATQLGQFVRGTSGMLVAGGIGAQVVVAVPGFVPASSKVVATCNSAAAAPVGGISIDHSVAGQITIASNNVADAGLVFDFFGIL